MFGVIGWLALELATPLSASAVPEPVFNTSQAPVPLVEGHGITFTRMSTADGLSQTRTAQIVQDDRGFIWFGTQHGLNRYDGYRFRVFLHEPGRPGSIAGNFIYSLFKDRSGMLWIGCEQSLDRLDPATEEFRHYRLESDGSEPGPVVHISQDRSGMLWLASGSGLRRLDPRTGQIRKYSRKPGDPHGLTSDDITFTGEDSRGTFWVGTKNSLDLFDRQSGTVKMHIPFEDAWQTSFYEDHAGVFWIMSGSGLGVLDRRTKVLTRYTFRDRDHANGAISGVMDMVEDRHGNLWLGSPSLGLVRFDRAGHRFVRYRNSASEPGSIGEDKVICLYVDREGNIWAGLNSKGPNRFNPAPPLFEQFRHEPWNPYSLRTDFVNAIYEDDEGMLWIGDDKGLLRIDRKTGRYRSFTAGLDEPVVINIIGDGSGSLWIATASRGVTHFNWRTGRFRNYRHNPKSASSLSNDRVHRLFIDHAGTLWAATDDGLDRFDATKGNFKVYRGGTRNYLYIAEDESGTLWLGTNDAGLQHFDPVTERFIPIKQGTGSSGSVEDNLVTGVRLDGRAALWLSTYNGLKRFDRVTSTFTSYDERNGLSGSAVSCILPDSRGNLWMSTNKGISSFSPSAGAFRNYTAADGLPGDDFTGWEACFKSPDGEMFFGGFSGAVAFRPENLKESSYAPQVTLTDLRLAGVPVGVGGSSPLRRSISYTDRLDLSHSQAAFSLTFSALSYISTATNRYRYKLEGIDRTWHQTESDDRIATYTTLPSGSYTFRAQAATSKGPWGEPGLELKIHILPRFWETLWFEAACCGIVCLSLWALYRIRLTQVHQEYNLRLEERVGERTRIARELHDTILQSFQGAVFEFQAARRLFPGRPADAMNTLDGAITSAEAAIAEGRDAIQNLRPGAGIDSNLAHLLTAAGKELSDTQDPNGIGAAFRLTVEGAPRSLSPALQDEVYRIGREILRNAFHHAHATKIEVEIRYDDRMLRLRIRDDGTGIDPKVLDPGARPGHWGLPGVRERAKLVGAKLDFWSDSGAGTEVQLTAPASVAYQKPPEARIFGLFRKTTRSHVG